MPISTPVCFTFMPPQLGVLPAPSSKTANSPRAVYQLRGLAEGFTGMRLLAAISAKEKESFWLALRVSTTGVMAEVTEVACSTPLGPMMPSSWVS